MSTFPNFSQIKDGITSKLDKRKGNSLNVSGLNTWVRLTSGAFPGLTMYSNPNFALFGSAGIYGNMDESGVIGTKWNTTSKVGGGKTGPQRPSAIVTSLEIDEGAGNLSRKATYSITCFSKSQMEELTKYFLEPGFSIFIEWGWNTASGVGGLVSLDASTVSSFQSFQKTDERRKTGGYEYDNYLGFNTGGSIAMEGDKWIISGKCTGYTELPSYLVTSETGVQPEGSTGILASEPIYGENDIDTAGKSALGKQRWMKCYNLLPGTRQTAHVKALQDVLSDETNFIGFDEEVSTMVNDSTDGKSLLGFTFAQSKLLVGGVSVAFPKGTKIVSDQKFIRFSALMEIFNAIGVEGYTLNGEDDKLISFTINTKDTPVSAFKYIYSIDSTKLFIPNKNTPAMKLAGITDVLPPIDTLISSATLTNNMVGGVVEFPNSQPLNQTQTNGADTVTKDPDEWGNLHDLYVNFDFAKGVMDTKNFFIKDAIYQILNGMSSAVNGMWDFQLEEHAVDEFTTELRVFETNCITNDTPSVPYTFQLSGPDSIFMEASFDLDISGAKMNQIIGARLGQSLNGDTKHIPKALFSNKTDMIKVKMKKKDDPVKIETIDKDDAKEANLNLILGKLSFYPKIEHTEQTSFSGLDLYDICYLGAFNDSSIFSAFKTGKNTAEKGTAPLMPINFSFKIHGISGIKRGDKFKVNGIPSTYNSGFFQVLSVKHSIEGMVWTTEVTGGYRPKR
tara:strand:- start:1698 stop:3893 length:2196 start_codon:yes stop_codon:yes gene_type:complete